MDFLKKARRLFGIAAVSLGLLSGCGTDGVLPDVPDETITLDGCTYKLTMMDDFDGTELNRAYWNYCPEWGRADVGGRWSNSCTRLDGEGHLILSARLDEDGTPLSGAIRSKGKFQQCGGYFEAKCRLQSAHGLWTAFWLMCEEEGLVGNGAADGAEIDIFESFDRDNGKINHALHWDGYGDDHKSWSRAEKRPDCYDEDFHTYGLLWNEEAYTFYIDGKAVRQLSADDKDYPGCCKAATYLKFTVECGTWAGTLDPEELPDDALSVDYVKVYRLESE